jgi:hypothetical protein
MAAEGRAIVHLSQHSIFQTITIFLLFVVMAAMLAGCPRTQPVHAKTPGLYATPENTSVELLAPCRLDERGQPVEPCKFRLHINAVQVQK